MNRALRSSTRRTDASIPAAKAGSRAVLGLDGSEHAGHRSGVGRQHQIAAGQNRTARSGTGTAATALAAPTSSVTMTPLPSFPTQQVAVGDDDPREHRSIGLVDLRRAQDTITMPTLLATPGPERFEEGSSALVCASVIPTVVTSVLPVIPLQPGEVLDRCDHTVPDCSAVTSSGTAALRRRGRCPALAARRMIGGIGVDHRRRDRVGHGCEADVDPRGPKPSARVALECAPSWVGDIFPG